MGGWIFQNWGVDKRDDPENHGAMHKSIVEMPATLNPRTQKLSAASFEVQACIEYRKRPVESQYQTRSRRTELQSSFLPSHDYDSYSIKQSRCSVGTSSIDNDDYCVGSLDLKQQDFGEGTFVNCILSVESIGGLISLVERDHSDEIAAPVRSLSCDLTPISGSNKRLHKFSMQPQHFDSWDRLHEPETNRTILSRTRSRSSTSSLPNMSVVNFSQPDHLEYVFQNQSVPKKRQFKLCSRDELHVIPCQCALHLMGMQDAKCNSPESTGDFSWNVTLFSPPPEHGLAHGLTIAAMLSKLSSGLPVGLGLAHENKPGHTVAPKKQHIKTINSPRIHSGVVRTVSGQAALRRTQVVSKHSTKKHCEISKKSEISTKSEISNKSTSLFPGPSSTCSNPVKTHKGSASHTFISVNYHEIVLICMEDDDETFNIHDITNEELVLDIDAWNTITMRCYDHESMDEVVRALQASSKCKIVPFSSNPSRERAKQIAATSNATGYSFSNLISETSNHKAVGRHEQPSSKSRKADYELISHPPVIGSIRRSDSRSCEGDSLVDSEHLLEVDDTQDSINSWKKSVADDKSIPKEKTLTVRRSSTLGQAPKNYINCNWSNADECEFCSLLFTLLSRRHHCRKCDHSCCEDCSSIVFLCGGEETRLCNRCNSNVLGTPQTFKNKRDQRKDSTRFLGKVHESCISQGVGIMGVLPNWKNYFTFNQQRRPAVGRITVEIVEALALKRMDLTLKCNPYVRATITGYDYDLEWNLVEWEKENRFTLTTSYCSSTLSPVWRGPGRKGGQVLTLPVVSSSGAILRLEVLHFDGITNAAGVDPVIGIVEIPLSDLPNSNLRKSESVGSQGYNGFVERWFHLETPPNLDTDEKSKAVFLSRPISSPIAPATRTEAPRKRQSVMTKFARTMDEIGHWGENACKVPMEWIGAALGIDMPRMLSDRDKRRTKSSIHVGLKLNLSEVGDLLSHAWFPPVRERPKRPPFDPEITYGRVMHIARKAEPYGRGLKFIERCIKWKQPPMICIYFYLVVAFHIAVFHKLIYFIHVYLAIFLVTRLWKCKNVVRAASPRANFISGPETSLGGTLSVDTAESKTSDESDRKSIVVQLPTRERKGKPCPPSPSLLNFTQQPMARGNTEVFVPKEKQEDEETAAGLNKIIVWAAKKWLSSRGMDSLQYKLAQLSHDITIVNSVWDGSSRISTCVALLVCLISLALHCFINVRHLWIFVITIVHFGPSPILQKFVRFLFGINRGVAKIIRRRHLHLLEEETQTLFA